MRIGIIGAGRLGGVLAARLADAGHELMLGGHTSAQETGSRLGIPARTPAGPAPFGGVIGLAVPFQAIDDALALSRPPEGRVLWSCVNAVKPDYSGLAIGFDTSAAEEGAKQAAPAPLVACSPTS